MSSDVNRPGFSRCYGVGPGPNAWIDGIERLGIALESLAFRFESGGPMGGIAEGLVGGLTATTNRYPLTLRNGVGVSLGVYHIDGAINPQRSVGSNFNLYVCHNFLSQLGRLMKVQQSPAWSSSRPFIAGSLPPSWKGVKSRRTMGGLKPTRRRYFLGITITWENLGGGDALTSPSGWSTFRAEFAAFRSFRGPILTSTRGSQRCRCTNITALPATINSTSYNRCIPPGPIVPSASNRPSEPSRFSPPSPAAGIPAAVPSSAP